MRGFWGNDDFAKLNNAISVSLGRVDMKEGGSELKMIMGKHGYDPARLKQETNRFVMVLYDNRNRWSFEGNNLNGVSPQ